MRRIKFLVRLLLVVVLMSTFSCKKYLDDNINKSTVADDAQWASEGNADIFLNAIYGRLCAMNNTPDPMDCFTDDNDGSQLWKSWPWKQGTVGPSNNGGEPFRETQGGSNATFASWNDAYTSIRRCNLFIEKVTLNKGNVFTPAYAAKRIDEVKFLRAYWYAMLWQHVGGLPIITKTLNNNDGTEIYYARNTFEETYNFIVSELTAIVTNNKLAVKYSNGNTDAGRATIGAAQFVKAWVQLYAASPAWNSGTSPTGVADPNNLIHFASADNNRWAAAAASFKYFMDNFPQYSLYNDMTKFWYEANEYNSEVIWDKQQVQGIGGQLNNNIDQYGGPVWIYGTYHTWGNYCPNQELVDDYRMANGKRINETGSGYDPKNPYVGRENRFYQFIVYDGAPYKQDWMPTTDIIYTRIDDNKNSPNYNGGPFIGKSNRIVFDGSDPTRTGYYFRKKLNNTAFEGGNRNGQNQVYYRYAEVLLGYAEAQNEALGSPDQSVYDALNKVRQRPGTNLPKVDFGTLNKLEMQREIRDQRRIEFAFENRRYYDLIRWKIAKDILNVDRHSMVIKNTVPADNSGVWTYTVTPLNHPHVFTDKMYISPVPQGVMDNNKKLIQNPGY
ncbi:RagB/SusD family nutrient uptake outer membrane protein [Mucilaginibacter sp. HD30]